MRFAAVFAVVCAALASSSSHAQVAVAVVIPEANPTLHDVAAGVIDVVDDHWQMLKPQLEPADVAACNADATCLQALAAAHHASHLVVVDGTKQRGHALPGVEIGETHRRCRAHLRLLVLEALVEKRNGASANRLILARVTEEVGDGRDAHFGPRALEVANARFEVTR